MIASTLPQWKREILQRRAARSSPRNSATQQDTQKCDSPPTQPSDEEEELRYGPGIVKRLKSRYLSLALREAPRRRPSVLRRATSLEHVLDEQPQPVIQQTSPNPPVPQQRRSLQIRNLPTRRESMKRARSVDALSRFEPREDENTAAEVARPCRVPKRPSPLLSESERPPPDVVRAALRKFEPTSPKRGMPSARVSGVLRSFESKTPPRLSVVASTQTTPSLRRLAGRPPVPPRSSSPRSSTPEPRTRTPSPAVSDLSSIAVNRDETDESTPPKMISRAALEGIAKAGSTVSFTFDNTQQGTHLPPINTNLSHIRNLKVSPVSPRQVGVIRPMPALNTSEDSSRRDDDRFIANERCDKERKASAKDVNELCASVVIEELFVSEKNRDIGNVESVQDTCITNGDHAENKLIEKIKRINIEKNAKVVNAKIDKQMKECEVSDVPLMKSPVDIRNGRRLSPSPRHATEPVGNTMVFNFSTRKEIPDYIENDGLILRASKREKLKPGDPGVILLKRSQDIDTATSDHSDSDDEGCMMNGPPSPCDVRFINDNILINGKSSFADATNKDRLNKLKLQFNDSLTRTFEYPSEASYVEESPTTPLQSNTHLSSPSLSSYQPLKMKLQESFQLGVTRSEKMATERLNGDNNHIKVPNIIEVHSKEMSDAEYLKPCNDAEGVNWSSETNQGTSDLLF